MYVFIEKILKEQIYTFHRYNFNLFIKHLVCHELLITYIKHSDSIFLKMSNELA